MLGNRYSQHSFAQIPDAKIARSQFDRSFGVKDAFDFDYLVPIFVDEILPGDTCNLTVNTFARLATQKVPIMDNMYVDYFFFFVPNRLVWDNWEKFNGAQDNPGDSTDFILPQIQTFSAGSPDVGTIYDKMGLPTDVPNAWDLPNSLPFRAYSLIWNEWFRDQNMQNSLTVPLDDGPDSPSDFGIMFRNKRHDYFTSALPWPQKGPAVELPLGTTANVVSTGQNVTFRTATTTPTTNRNLYQDTAGALKTINGGALPGNEFLSFGSITGLEADLSTATAATINQLREAFAMQALFELDARGGTRYVEILRAHFNVVSPDFRLQRPEYLGGGTTTINSHPVPQTSPTDGSNPQAQLAAFATQSTTGKNIGFTKSFVEHGYVIGLACGRGEITYQQGLNKMWQRSTRYDFYWPKLAELGEQAVLTGEIYWQGNATDETVFGYQERYAEYRYKPSEIHGQFRSTYATSLDQWHLAQEFSSAPGLNDTFIRQTTPLDRCIAVPSEPHLLFDAWFNYKHARPMPVYSTPATLGRF